MTACSNSPTQGPAGDPGNPGDSGAMGATGAAGSPDDRAAILTKLAATPTEKSVLVQAKAMNTENGATIETNSLGGINLPDLGAALIGGVEVPADAQTGAASLRVRLFASAACTSTLRLTNVYVLGDASATNSTPDVDATFTTTSAGLSQIATLSFPLASIAAGNLVYWRVARQSDDPADGCGGILVMFNSLVYLSATP